MTTVADIQQRFDRAELEADRETLEELIAEDFLSIGPKGFVLDKRQWIDRHDLFTYQALDTSELDVREYGDTAIVRTVQHNKATYADEPVAIATRVCQVWVDQGGRWRLAGIQFSPLAAS
jgi:ketosteroid isomerase-like protein